MKAAIFHMMRSSTMAKHQKHDLGDDYWASHPDHPQEDWMDEVREGDTRLGYWDWVIEKLEQA